MPPRLTLRELEARRRRAEEGFQRFKAAEERIGAEIASRGRDGSLEAALGDLTIQRTSTEALEEMAAAVKMIRGGLPKATVEVGFI